MLFALFVLFYFIVFLFSFGLFYQIYFICLFVINVLFVLFCLVGFVWFCLFGNMFPCFFGSFVWLFAFDFFLFDTIYRYGEAVQNHAKHVTLLGNSIHVQLFHTFLCNSQNYNPEVLWMIR